MYSQILTVNINGDAFIIQNLKCGNPTSVVLQFDYLTPNPSLPHTLTHTQKSTKREKETKMLVAKQSYEESRGNRVEVNKKRLEALNLPLLSQALKSSSSPKPSSVSLSLSLSLNTKTCHFFVFLFHNHLLFLMPTFT